MKNVDWGTWLSQTYKKYDYDITIIAHLEPKDYGIYARKNYYFGYNNSHYQDLIKKLKTEINKNKRLQLLQKIQVTLSDDAVNVWLYQAPKIGVWNKKLSGMWKNYPVAGNILKMFIGSNIKGLMKILIKLLLSILVVMLITFLGIEHYRVM